MLFTVQVQAGNLVFEIGYLQYAETEPKVLMGKILGPCLGFIFAVIVIAILVWMKRTKRGPFRKKMMINEPSIHYTPASRSHQDQQTYRLNHDHHENRKQKY